MSADSKQDQNKRDQNKQDQTQPSMPIQAVLFDYGLVLTGPPDPAAWAHMREVTGLSEEKFFAAYWAPRHDYDRGTHLGSEYWHAVAKQAGILLDGAQVTALIAADTELWTQLNEPMVDFARRLQAAGTRTGILSNIGDAIAEGIQAKLPWLQEFDHRVWSHSLRMAKPEAAIYAHAAEGLDTSPANILFIDDREDNIAGALAAGMQAIRYTDQADFERELQARGLDALWREGRMPALRPQR